MSLTSTSYILQIASNFEIAINNNNNNNKAIVGFFFTIYSIRIYRSYALSYGRLLRINKKT